jgi:hypothetical protein
MTQEPPSTIQSVAADSRLWHGGQAVGRAWSEAWHHSWVGQGTTLAAIRLRGMTPALRVRMGGLVVAWTCAWHLAALYFLPRYATSGLPRVWFVAAGMVALVIAFAADAFVRAWEPSALRRVFR